MKWAVVSAVFLFSFAASAQQISPSQLALQINNAIAGMAQSLDAQEKQIQDLKAQLAAAQAKACPVEKPK